jgi:hypothetical protein
MNDDGQDEPQRKTVGRPFQRGDERINRTGRPKTFDELRRTAEMIASEMVPGPDGKMISRGELLLRNWIKSKNPILQRAFLEYWVGKPADRLELDQLQPGVTLRLHYANSFGEKVTGPFPDFPDLPPNIARQMQRRLKDEEASQDISENS